MFEEMTEQQAREQILEMTRNYCKRNHIRKVTVSRMRPEFMMQKKW
jgi:hypothetical protein